jgi:hypothetical protein
VSGIGDVCHLLSPVSLGQKKNTLTDHPEWSIACFESLPKQTRAKCTAKYDFALSHRLRNKRLSYRLRRRGLGGGFAGHGVGGEYVPHNALYIIIPRKPKSVKKRSTSFL